MIETQLFTACLSMQFQSICPVNFQQITLFSHDNCLIFCKFGGKSFKNSVLSSKSHIIFLIKKILELYCSADYSSLKFYCYFDIFPHIPFSVLFPDSVKGLHCIIISYEDTNLAQFAISELSLLQKKKKTRKQKIGNSVSALGRK